MSAYELYFNLLVLCVSFMDYGDIIPFTIPEELFSLIVMILGRLFISFIFAEVQSYVSSYYSSYNNHINQKNRVIKWMQLNNIAGSLRKRVLRYFEFKWNNGKGIEEEVLLKDLPQSIRGKVKKHIFSNLVMNCDLLPSENPGTVTTILSKLQRRMIPKDEYIIKQGELAQEMFFILKGEVKVVSAEGITVAVLKKFMYFGEMALIQKRASVRTSSIIANTNTVLAALTAKDFYLICTHYPEFHTRIQEIVELRAKDSISKGVINKRSQGDLRNSSN